MEIPSVQDAAKSKQRKAEECFFPTSSILPFQKLSKGGNSLGGMTCNQTVTIIFLIAKALTTWNFRGVM